MKNVCVIILAGGRGERFHGKKQFLIFHGKELWKYVYDTSCQCVTKENIVVVGIDIQGGDTRNGSVKNGLEWIKVHNNCERVVILEAARAFVTTDQLKAIIESNSKSITYVNPVVDTVILKDKTYINRNDCLHLVSPQAFDFKMLYDAYKNTELAEIRTDETRLMSETYGIKPDFLDGDQNLFKVTYQKDIAVLEEIYRIMEESKL